MARNFVRASAEKIDLSLGAGGSQTGAFTLAAICRRATNQLMYGIAIGNNATTLHAIRWNSAGVVGMLSNNATSSTTTTWGSADGWLLLVASKASGTATPRMHVYKYSTQTWTHENGASTLATSTPSGGSNFGSPGGLASFDGDVAVGGTWNENLTDAQVEPLAFSLHPWFRTTTNGLWVLDQASTSTKVWDLTGGGANESGITGTTVTTSAVPVWNRGAPIAVVNFTAAGTTVTGDAAIAGAGAISASGVRTRSGAAAIAGAGAVSASGTRTRSGAATIAGSGTISASGTVTRSGAAAIAGNGAISATGARTTSGAATIAGTGTVVIAGVRTVLAEAAISGNGTIVAAGEIPARFPSCVTLVVTEPYACTLVVSEPYECALTVMEC